MLEDGDVSFKDQPEFINILGRMCRQLKTIPDSMRIENCPTDPMCEGYDGGYATVYRSEYKGRAVAVKTLHLYLSSDFKECFSVSTEGSQVQRKFHSHRTVSRNFAGRSLSGGTCGTHVSYRLSG